jgi:mono/diheme cytochrome c family protein
MILVKKKINLILVIAAVLITASCKHDRNQPGYAYMADFDMYYSEPYNAYTANPVFGDSITMQVPVDGTIPRGFLPYQYGSKSLDEQVRAGKELVNPLDTTEMNLAEGKRQYEIFCMVCHGEIGDGNGNLYTSGLYTAKPTSLIDSYVQDKPDGEIYHVIAVGSVSGLMGAYGSQITPENRWRIVQYVRQLGNN